MEAKEEDHDQEYYKSSGSSKMKKAIELNLNNSTNSSDDSQESSKSITPNQSKTRTYDCTFCKKGFSNAQALGGHMNIHRKDKAKLRQNINSNLDNPKLLLKPSSYSPMNISSPQVNWPLFLSHNIKETSEGSKGKNQVEKAQVSSEHHGSSDSELDLELRLGPEHPSSPPEDSSTKLGTRKFF